MKYSPDMALMLGIKQSADNLLIHAKTGGKFSARNPGVKHGVIQGRFRRKKRVECNKDITISICRLRDALAAHKVAGYGFGEAICGFNKGFFLCLSVSGRAGEIRKFNKI